MMKHHQPMKTRKISAMKNMTIHFIITAMLRMSGALAKSTDVMKSMSSLLRVPEIQATMRELSKEMTKVIT